MLNAIAILLLCQLAGEITSQILGLPIPGPVVGMALLLLLARVLPGLAASLRETCNAILGHLSLLFVPAGVGVMLHATRVLDEWLTIIVSLLAGTIITLVVTAFTIKVMMRVIGLSPIAKTREEKGK